MRQWLWKDTIDCVGQYNSEYIYILSLASILAIFAICVLLDYLRIHSVEKWTFKWLDKRIA